MKGGIPDVSRYAATAEEKRLRKERVYDLYVNQKKSWSQIAKLTKLSRMTVYLIRRELIADGKLETGPNGRITKSKKQRNLEAYETVARSDFVAKHDCIKNLHEAYRGSPRSAHVTAMWVICATLKVSPEAFLVSTKETQRLYDLFVERFLRGEAVYLGNAKSALTSGENTSHGRYRNALRQFCRVNDKQLPDRLKGNLSGKKENYGKYNDVYLTDAQFRAGLKFFGEVDDGHGPEWAAMFAFCHDAFPRPAIAVDHAFNFKAQHREIDGSVASYLADTVYESKTATRYPKWIFRRESVEAMRDIQPNRRILDHLAKSQGKKRMLARLREFYYSEHLLEPDQHYRKVVDGAQYYLSTKPMHALRHSGCHFMMRSSGNNASIVAKFGWEDLAMITQVYASISADSILDQGLCYQCNPPKSYIQDADLIFCSLRHAVAYHSSRRSREVL